MTLDCYRGDAIFCHALKEGCIIQDTPTTTPPEDKCNFDLTQAIREKFPDMDKGQGTFICGFCGIQQGDWIEWKDGKHVPCTHPICISCFHTITGPKCEGAMCWHKDCPTDWGFFGELICGDQRQCTSCDELYSIESFDMTGFELPACNIARCGSCVQKRFDEYVNGLSDRCEGRHGGEINVKWFYLS